MKLIAIKPIYLNGSVVAVDAPFETNESHGRELILKGYASLVAGQQHGEPVQQQEVEQPAPETSSRSRSK
ncbi:DUF7210 family protein [Serratia fonticola]|uniref:DUF7210 family protein n=1 Tax=Serratia fonticola TaxID=47917 RepID=UPI0034C61CFE